VGFAQKVLAGSLRLRRLDVRRGRSPNEEKSFSARQSLASHRGGEAAENRLFVQG